MRDERVPVQFGLHLRRVRDGPEMLGVRGQYVGMHAQARPRVQRQPFAERRRLHVLERQDVQFVLRLDGELRSALPPRVLEIWGSAPRRGRLVLLILPPSPLTPEH
jgi:hypothetical protein